MFYYWLSSTISKGIELILIFDLIYYRKAKMNTEQNNKNMFKFLSKVGIDENLLKLA